MKRNFGSYHAEHSHKILHICVRCGAEMEQKSRNLMTFAHRQEWMGKYGKPVCGMKVDTAINLCGECRKAVEAAVRACVAGSCPTREQMASVPWEPNP